MCLYVLKIKKKVKHQENRNILQIIIEEKDDTLICILKQNKDVPVKLNNKEIAFMIDSSAAF